MNQPKGFVNKGEKTKVLNFLKGFPRTLLSSKNTIYKNQYIHEITRPKNR
jgi:hypothetical protein